MDETTKGQVRERAQYVCEYCLLPESEYPVEFEIDHVIAKQHGGSDALSNLALACLHCNGFKEPNLSSIDPRGSQYVPVRLFNPRRHKWSKHFRYEGGLLHGLTPIGRATIVCLAMNDPVTVALREELVQRGVFPPGV